MTAARRRLESRQRIAAMSPEELEQMRAQGLEQFKEDVSEAPGALAQGLGNFARFLTEDPERTVKLGGLFTDAGGIAEAFGYYPDPFNEGEFLPSALQQAKEGDYLGAGLTSLGAIPLVGIFARGLKGARLVEGAYKYEKFGDSSVKLDADPFGDENTLLINELTATEFRKGYGKGIMKDLIEQAEEQGKKLTLFPQQLEGITGGMDDEALVSFYKSLGFKTRFAPTDDTPYDSLPDFNKYLIYEPKTVKATPTMSEAEYNAAIGAARNDKALQQKLIAEKNEFYPKKDKKKKEKTPEKTARQIAEAASEGTEHQIGNVRKRSMGGRSDEQAEAFGFDGGDFKAQSPYQKSPNLTRYSTAATRALVKMKKPGQNISGDALLNRLELSVMNEDRSGIRALIEEMGGLDDPNFIGADGKGATITYDQFVKRLIDFGPKRNVIRHSSPDYANLQELSYIRPDSFDAATDGQFTLTPVSARSYGTGGDDGGGFVHHRFANLHVHDKNIQAKTPVGEKAQVSTSHRHYTDMSGEIENVFEGSNNAEIIAHSRGGLYVLNNSPVVSDNGFLTLNFDEFQVDGMSKLSKARTVASPQKLLKEKSDLQMKMTDYSYNAGELGNKAVERFVAVDDPYTKEFSNIFSFYKTDAGDEGEKIADMLAMDAFIDDLGKPGQGVPTNPYSTQVDARKFWEKNFHTFFNKPEYDPSNPKFLAKYLQSKEGQEAFESHFNSSFAGLRDRGDFGGYKKFGERLAEYAKGYEQRNATGTSVIESISKIIADDSGKTNRFRNLAFENGNIDPLKEQAMEYTNTANELETLLAEGTGGSNIIDRAYIQSVDKFGDTITKLQGITENRRAASDFINKAVDERTGLVNQKIKDFQTYSRSMANIDADFAKKNKQNLKTLKSLANRLQEIEARNDYDGVAGKLRNTKTSKLIKDIVKSFENGTDLYKSKASDINIGDISPFDVSYELSQGQDYVLALLLDADFSSELGLRQFDRADLNITNVDTRKNRLGSNLRPGRADSIQIRAPGDEGKFSFTSGPAEELNTQRELLQDIQFGLRSLFGADYENISKAFRADTKLANENLTIRELSDKQSELSMQRAMTIAAEQEKNPEFSEELVNQITSGGRRSMYDLPFDSVKDSIGQVVQGDLANTFDGYLMQHLTPQPRTLTADDLLEPTTSDELVEALPMGVPKFITIPTAGKTMQTRGKSFDDPGGFAFQDSGRDDAIKAFMEDNPDLVTIRKDLTETATRQNQDLPKEYQNKDVVLEINEDVRRQYARAFAEANNTLLEQYKQEALAKNFASVEAYIGQFDNTEMAEILREEAMRVFKRNNLDGETYVRYAKGGEVNLHKGIGAMAREVL